MTVRGELLIWTTATACLAATGLVLGRRPQETALVATAVPVSARPDAPVSTARDARDVVTSDPFRLDRSPAPLRFEPGRRREDMPAMMPAAPLQRPALLLRAVVGGPPWEALVEGLPGRNGPALVRTGERIGEFVIRSIKRDSVVVVGADTTWRLALTRPWP